MEFLTRFPDGVEIAYAAIPEIRTLSEPLKTQVRVAFAESLSLVWKSMVGIAGIGVLALFLLKEVEMKTHTDSKFGLDDENRPVALQTELGKISRQSLQ